MIEQLFFELIRVAIGTQVTLSRPPSACEWKELYNMAKKQSLVGICFAGLQKLYNSVNQEPSTHNPQPNSTQNQEPRTKNLDEVQYLTWMGMAAKIQQRNEAVNRQCVELNAKLSADGIRSCILKGQAIASLYTSTGSAQVGDLALLRQSGDIDLLVDCERKEAVDYVQKKGIKIGRWDYKHLDVEVFPDTEVEMHYRPGVSLNLWRNRRLQKFWKENAEEFYVNSTRIGGGEIVTPSSRMHTFYILHHTFRHLISGGIGLRQVMDLYFALLNRNRDDDEWLKLQVKAFGMKDFAEAITWVIREVFGMSMLSAPWIPNEREGRFVLNEIMIGGNFGKGDVRYNKADSHVGILRNIIRRDLHLASHYGSEALMAPLYYMWHFCWKRMNK